MPSVRGGGSRPASIPGSLGSSAPYDSAGSPIMAFYPTAIDSAPAMTDSQTPLVAMWVNLLQQMVEAVEAEIGPIPIGMQRSHMPGRQVDTLQKLLGQQTDAGAVPYTESYAGLCSAIDGNNKPTGTLYGVQKVRVTRSSWTQLTDYTVDITNPFGPSPGFQTPIAWGVPIQPNGVSMNSVMMQGPSRIVAQVASMSYSGSLGTLHCQYAAQTVDPTNNNGVPTGTWTFDICVLYMPTEDDA